MSDQPRSNHNLSPLFVTLLVLACSLFSISLSLWWGVSGVAALKASYEAYAAATNLHLSTLDSTIEQRNNDNNRWRESTSSSMSKLSEHVSNMELRLPQVILDANTVKEVNDHLHTIDGRLNTIEYVNTDQQRQLTALCADIETIKRSSGKGGCVQASTTSTK